MNLFPGPSVGRADDAPVEVVLGAQPTISALPGPGSKRCLGVLIALCLSSESRGLSSTEGQGRLREKWTWLERPGRGQSCGWVTEPGAAWDVLREAGQHC